jgi:hypothetical protein
VLNADDPLVMRMADKTSARVVSFSMNGEHRSFDECYYLRDEAIWQKKRGTTARLIGVNDIAVTHGGIFLYHIANAMAVLAAVDALQDTLPVPTEKILATLKSFGEDPQDNFARFSLVEYRGERLLLCFCKNPQCYRFDKPLIKKVKEAGAYDYVVGLLTTVGGRPPDYYQEISRLAAPACDAFSIRPPVKRYLRGLAPGEIVDLLSSSIPPEKLLEPLDYSLQSTVDAAGERFDGRILFVLFFAIADPAFDLGRVLEEGRTIAWATPS